MKRGGWVAEAAEDWNEKTLGYVALGRLGKALKILVDRHGWGKVRPAWQRYLNTVQPQFLSPERFVATFKAYTFYEPKITYQTVDEADRRAGIL